MNLPWWQSGIIYQIYPRSFADSNGDGIGDLNGITARLDYLADLGVAALWLSPVYPSPDADFGYDISDYCAIDPKFGNLADFDRLVSETHARGLRIILDLVLNHTSDQHPWFVESRASRDNPKRDWYLWRDPSSKGGLPNNWQSVFGGSGWQMDSITGQYYFHMFTREQPDVNWHNPAVRQAMLDVFRFWLERGVDGFRLDVFNEYFKHHQFADNPVTFPVPRFGFAGQKHVNDVDQPEMLPLLKDIRALLDAYSTPGHERYAVGETFGIGKMRAADYIGPDKLHAAFNFTFIGLPWSGERYLHAILDWEHALGSEWPNYVFNNHDVIRSATRLHALIGDSQVALVPHGDLENDARLKVLATLLLTLRGTPFMYYGEEIGMRDLPIHSKDEVLDPVGRRFWPFIKGRDGCRAPMQWDASANAGFAPVEVLPWLPVHADYAFRNVAAQQVEPESLLNVYRRLIALRRASPALTGGLFMPLSHGRRALLAYLRQTPEQTLLVALNFAHRRQRLVLGAQLARSTWRLVFSTRPHPGSHAPIADALLTLAPDEAMILELL